MPASAAIGCVNRSGENSNSISFHRIPCQRTRSELRKKWLLNIRRDGQLPKDSCFVICSEHFEAECFERDLRVSFKLTSIIGRGGGI